MLGCLGLVLGVYVFVCFMFRVCEGFLFVGFLGEWGISCLGEDGRIEGVICGRGRVSRF